MGNKTINTKEMGKTIRGEGGTRRVWIDGLELRPGKSLKVRNHSPTGFNWGYGGSGPAQLALAIMLELAPGAATMLYQDFKREVVAAWKIDEDFWVPLDDVLRWIEERRPDMGAVKRHPVEGSSNIKSMGYSPESQVLQIEFKGGGIYEYYDVPEPVYKFMLAAESKGHYFATHIKPYFPCERVTNHWCECVSG